jgi:hypothetical protein
MGQPIEDKAKVAAANGGDAGPKTQTLAPVHSQNDGPGAAEENFGPQNAVRAEHGLPPLKPAVSPEENLIKDQHLFIEALLDFIHNPSEVPQFAGAQEMYIRAQMAYAEAKLDRK